MALQFKSLSGQPLIEVPDNSFELAIETPQGLFNIKLEDLISFVNAGLASRVAALENAAGEVPELNDLILTGDVEGRAPLDLSQPVTVSVTVPDGALNITAVAGLALKLLTMQQDIDSAHDKADSTADLVSTKLDATATAVAAQKLEPGATINGIAFDGTQSIVIPTGIGSGLDWQTVTQTDVGELTSHAGYLFDTGGQTRDATLPTTVEPGYYTTIKAIGGNVRVVSNGNQVEGVGIGNDLMLEEGNSIALACYAPGMLSIVAATM